MSGLTTNFWKSCLFGVGVEDSFLDVASHFLACNSSRVPFKFLGLYVGGNHRRINFWKPVADCFRVRLPTWKGKLLSIGERVTLINSVLTNPSYSPFFFFQSSC